MEHPQELDHPLPALPVALKTQAPGALAAPPVVHLHGLVEAVQAEEVAMVVLAAAPAAEAAVVPAAEAVELQAPVVPEDK